MLSKTHPHGRSKAVWFQKKGFTAENAETLREQLIEIFSEGELVEKIKSNHGLKYVIVGVVRTAQEAQKNLKTVWIQETGNDDFRLVTAYPTGVE